MIVALTLVFGLYCVVLIVFIAGWNVAVEKKSLPNSAFKNFISVIVPARNETANIGNLLSDLSQQMYTSFEVIVVNDHSDDGTFRIVEDFTSLAKITIIENSGIGKKHALRTGIDVATGNIIVTTDADCRVGETWLDSINQAFQNDKIKFVFGGVKLNDNDTLFGSLQQMEFSSLIGSGAATFSLGIPTMCNGANVAFRKDIFFEAGSYDDNLHIPSGDDEFLMRKVAALYPDGLSFLSSQTSVVSTRAVSTLKEFLHQRIRWAGKWRHHRRKDSSMLAAFIFVFQLCALATFAAILLGNTNVFLISALLLKIVFELIFLRKINAFLNNRWNWLSFILLQLIYPFYVVSIGLLANVRSFEWKGRKLKSIQPKPMYP